MAAQSAAGELDRTDIQGMTMRPYRFPFAHYHVLNVSDSAKARRWFAGVAGRCTTVAGLDASPSQAFNVALSWQGLSAIGVPQATLSSFSQEFRQGMAARADRLGDVGDSAPARWDPPFNARVHVLAVVSAMTEAERNAASAALLSEVRDNGLTAAIAIDAKLLPGPDGGLVPIEHFGYRDGITQPAIEGSGEPVLPGAGIPDAGGWRALKAGEFVLGQPDEMGAVADLPTPASFSGNGSFVVLRKLHQNVWAFRNYLRSCARDDADAALLAAKMMGRWPSGAPLALAAERDDPALAADPQRNNDFTYLDDLQGTSCPMGAHVRRLNPRSGLTGPNGASVHRHRLLRQGLPYGSRLPADATADDGAARGAIMLLVNADIARQFEFVQKVWINDGNFAGLENERDPMIGGNDGSGTFTIPRVPPPRRRLKNLPAFVSTRGGEYFFLPGITALRSLAEPAAGTGS
ncbi:Dyp-type peroxidase [Bradyrhizobium sp. BR 10289]|uniref:Dyp-type peroxidase n=1 Tax=Bradyrhizobium sp. BR 10289 TaxID=2749993 RepID=UPI001C64FDC8|nr:Dyp-type peroxidase [Bradyrhizobium sp. BR 10289]MBW7969426.1 Dyp-type peroxidase [Bradyrhizobium sp. BR 10289]